AMAYVARGKALEQRGKLDEADGEMRRAVELARRGVAKAEIGYALLAYAQVRHDLGQHDEARALVREARHAVESCPDPGVLVEMLAQAERRLRAGGPTRSPAPDELTDRELAVLLRLPTKLSV